MSDNSYQPLLGKVTVSTMCFSFVRSFVRAAALFTEASDGAVKIGERLATAERQRQKVCNAIEVMRTIQELQDLPVDSFAVLTGEHTEEQLRALLPASLRDSGWGGLLICSFKRTNN